MKSNKGIRRYEDILKQVMNVEELHYLREGEWEACIGVACVLAYLEDVPANIVLMGKYLHISPSNPHFKMAFGRLKNNGVFDPIFDVKNDGFLKGEIQSHSHPYLTPQHLSEISWCHIAGIAGGYCGVGATGKTS